MSYQLTPEKLQEISVRVVSRFMTKQADLNTAIADEGKSLELNPDQLRRVIETSNTLAYLRQLESATDRSFEFPVAEYTSVMGRMVIPDPVTAATPNVINTVSTEPTESVCPPFVSSMSDQEKKAMLFKEASRVRQTLTKMASEEIIYSFRLEELASKVQKDPLALEKLAQVTSEEELGQLAVLCGLEKAAATEGSVFSNKDLSDVLSLTSLLKEAREFVADRKQKEDFVKRAAQVFSHEPGFMSKAIGAPVEGAGYAAGKVGRGVVVGGAKAVKGVGSTIKQLSKGKTLMKRLENVSDIGAGVLGASSMSHANPVWDSIHK